jgi:hypothetical protein
MSGHIEAVVALHKTNSELVGARERLEGIPDWMKELHEEHTVKKSEIDAVAAKRDEAAKERRAAEAELSDAQERQKHFQSQISQVSTQREYTAVLKEIDTVKAQISDLEKRVLEAIDTHDEAEKELARLEEGFRELDERYQAELAKWEAEKPEVARKVEILSREVEELRSKLPRPFTSLFDRIYDRHGTTSLSRIGKIKMIRGSNAMWHCEACSYNVRPQIVIEIKNDGAIVQCDSCKRILYIEDEDE